MNEQLSLWSLISNASILVQIVLLLLFVASVVSWTMIYQRTVFYMNAQRALDAFENDFWSGIDLIGFVNWIKGCLFAA